LKWQALSSLFLSLLLMLGTVGLFGCDRVEVSSPLNISPISPKASPVTIGKLTEVSPPKVIQALNKVLDQYQPQVKILSPRPGETLSSTTVDVKLSLQDLPTFQDQKLQSGPNLHLIVDNNPYIAIYDPSQPYLLKDLAPGTHTLRVFAARPWHESFKNEGAYDQVTFNVITQTGDNSPDPNLPILTFNQPKGEFGAEPILLDYYLTNAPLHGVDEEEADSGLQDWRIRVTVNGESFVVDSWQSLYLKGFNEGENWIQLEFLNDKGDRVDNVFNNTVRVLTYHSQGQDTLSKITRGELSVEQVRQIVDPTYTPQETADKTLPAGTLDSTSEITSEPFLQTGTDETLPTRESKEANAKAPPSPSNEIAPKEQADRLEIKTQIPTEEVPEEQPEPILKSEPANVGLEVEPRVEWVPESSSQFVPTKPVPPTSQPVLKSPQSLEDLNKDLHKKINAIAKPEPLKPASKAIESKSQTETVTSSLDKIFEEKTEPIEVFKPDFSVSTPNSPDDKPLSPGIRYYDEDIE
jgi:hypothetical protein